MSHTFFRYLSYISRLDWVSRNRKGRKKKGETFYRIFGGVVCLAVHGILSTQRSPASKSVRLRHALSYDVMQYVTNHSLDALEKLLLLCFSSRNSFIGVVASTLLTSEVVPFELLLHIHSLLLSLIVYPNSEPSRRRMPRPILFLKQRTNDKTNE